jgi:RNA polymerase sigma-70 factor (ECF subfamily)
MASDDTLPAPAHLFPGTPQHPAEAAGEPAEELPLFARLWRGERPALERLVAEYTPFAYAIAADVLGEGRDAETAVTAAFVAAWESASVLPRPPANEALWVLTLVRREAIAMRRKQEPGEYDALDASLELLALAEGDTLWRDQLALLSTEDVRSAIEALPERQRAALLMAHFEGLQSKEIARRLQVSADTVREDLRAALTALPELLERQQSEEPAE